MHSECHSALFSSFLCRRITVNSQLDHLDACTQVDFCLSTIAVEYRFQFFIAFQFHSYALCIILDGFVNVEVVFALQSNLESLIALFLHRFIRTLVQTRQRQCFEVLSLF